MKFTLFTLSVICLCAVSAAPHVGLESELSPSLKVANFKAGKMTTLFTNKDHSTFAVSNGKVDVGGKSLPLISLTLDHMDRCTFPVPNPLAEQQGEQALIDLQLPGNRCGEIEVVGAPISSDATLVKYKAALLRLHEVFDGLRGDDTTPTQSWGPGFQIPLRLSTGDGDEILAPAQNAQPVERPKLSVDLATIPIESLLEKYNALVESDYKLVLNIPMHTKTFGVLIPDEFTTIAQTQVNFEIPVGKLIDPYFIGLFSSASLKKAYTDFVGRVTKHDRLKTKSVAVQGLMVLFAFEFYTKSVLKFREQKDRYELLIRTPFEKVSTAVRAVETDRVALADATVQGDAKAALLAGLKSVGSAKFTAAVETLFNTSFEKAFVNNASPGFGIVTTPIDPSGLACPGLVVEGRKTRSPLNKDLAPLSTVSADTFNAKLAELRALQACPA